MAFNKAKALQEAEKLVAQGKTSAAIKQYQDIAQNDPSDLNLLNTMGDLYVRERNIPRALEQFQKLADAYLREGFTLKAIAMYKKVSKLDSSKVEPLVKLAELYQLQGLMREAREQYLQAIDFYKRKKQNDKALEVLRTLLRLDPENVALRVQVGQFCEHLGLKADAAQIYSQAAELGLRRQDGTAAEAALKKAAALDSSNPRVRLLEARLALSKQKPGKAEKIISSLPELKTSPEGRRVLLEAYLADHKLREAQGVVSEVYRVNPADFSPLASFVALCIEKEDYDAALKPLADAVGDIIAHNQAGALVESLRRIWEKRPRDIPLLELMRDICERTKDEITLPEVLEALGHAYAEGGDLQKAEAAYRKLSEREPQNEELRGLLKQVLRKQGKELGAHGSADLSNVEMALGEPSAASPAAPSMDAQEASLVKEALNNSELYDRYGSIDKAVAELDKVLTIYPDQIEIHKRILEICQWKRPARAVEADQALARIYAQQGDLVNAKKYEDLARQDGKRVPGQRYEEPVAKVGPEVPHAPAVSATTAGESDVSAEVALSQEVVPIASESASAPAPAAQSAELDLSADWEAVVPPTSATVEHGAPAFNYEEARVEITFYLENGFVAEAQKALQALEGKYPGSSQLAELRELIDRHAVTAVAGTPEPAVTSPARAGFPPSPALAEAPGGEPAPSVRASSVQAQTPPRPPGPPRIQTPAETVATSGAVDAPGASGSDLVSSLAHELAASLDGIEAAPTPATRPSPVEAPGAGGGGPVSPLTSLSGLLEELGEPTGEQKEEGDPETHYSLGVAFREMGLFDEAIGEFQKVVRGAQKDKYPPNFLQACTLLATCFMDKKMPAIAVKWYTRALESPGLDEEATLALQYDLGVAYEQAGDTQTALEKFTEVYSQNIDFRDVAEKIRLLQKKGT